MHEAELISTSNPVQRMVCQAWRRRLSAEECCCTRLCGVISGWPLEGRYLSNLQYSPPERKRCLSGMVVEEEGMEGGDDGTRSGSQKLAEAPEATAFCYNGSQGTGAT